MTVNSGPIRLAILEADEPQPRTRQRVGLYRDVFAALLSQATRPRELSQVLSVTAHDVVHDLESYPALQDVDAVLITGSRHTSFDDDAWIVKLVDYTKRAIEGGRVKVIGVCFGHQIVARAMGAKLGKNVKGWEIAVTDVELTEKGRELFQLEKMRIQQMHRDIVFEYPEGAIPLGHNDVCSIQAMYSPGRYLTVQGHPEFTGELVCEVLEVRHEAGIFADELFEDGMRRATNSHDGVAIARAFIRFLEGSLEA